MEANKSKSLILNSVGKQKEFEIVEGPEYGLLGILVCDPKASVTKVTINLEFKVVVENDLGRTLVSYFIQPQNILDKGYFCRAGKYTVCRGFIRKLKTDMSSVRTEKHRLLKDGTRVYIIFDEEGGKGFLKVPGEENNGPLDFFKYVVEKTKELIVPSGIPWERVLTN